MNDPQPEGRMASQERRKFLATLGGAAAWPIIAHAQHRNAPPWLLRNPAARGAALCSLREARAELGYQPGRNFTLEYSQAPSIEGFESTYRELAGRKVDILLATGNEPA